MTETIETTRDGGIRTITLNRPDQLNSFDGQMHREMAAALGDLAQDTSARVLVIAAAGRAFCAGQDLSDDAVKPGGDLGGLIRDFYNPMIMSITQLPMPVIAKVQGVAAGAGANLALACDLVFAGEKASFIQAFAGIGLVPDSGGTWQLPKLIGQARAMGLALTGDKVSARDAEAMGMIWRCVADDELDQVVAKTAARFAAAPTMGLARTKQAIRAGATADLAAQLDLECNMQAELGASADYAEGVAAFTEKRQPNFTGR